jgi:hypothetical protein
MKNVKFFYVKSSGIYSLHCVLKRQNFFTWVGKEREQSLQRVNDAPVKPGGPIRCYLSRQCCYRILTGYSLNRTTGSYKGRSFTGVFTTGSNRALSWFALLNFNDLYAIPLKLILILYSSLFVEFQRGHFPFSSIKRVVSRAVESVHKPCDSDSDSSIFKTPTPS